MDGMPTIDDVNMAMLHEDMHVVEAQNIGPIHVCAHWCTCFMWAMEKPTCTLKHVPNTLIHAHVFKHFIQTTMWLLSTLFIFNTKKMPYLKL